MPEYRVTWEIDVEADSPVAAAREAYAIMQDPAAIPPVLGITEFWTERQWDIDMELMEEV